MMIVRPVALSDQAEILSLAHEAGIGMTSLPADEEVLHHKIKRAAASFAGTSQSPGEEHFLFALEDTVAHKLVGTVGVVAHVGLSHPFYSYKLSTIVQASTELGVYSLQRVLHMVNDYTGASEIGSLFVLPAYRRDGIGKFLSRCRYLLMAQYPELFSDTVISEIRGVQDEQGESPFYKNLAQHFFKMDFKSADFINATQGGQFISDLMPKYPIYVNLLDERAQAVIGKPLEASKAALSLLEGEGFRYQGYIDVFDAGPTVQADRASIRTVRKSRCLPVTRIAELPHATTHMVASTVLADFRVAFSTLAEEEGGVHISPRTAEVLHVTMGDTVRFIEA
jgi:arginine N-succinyltransferase